MRLPIVFGCLMLLGGLAGCASAPPPATMPVTGAAVTEGPARESLPPVPEVRGPLALRVIYPTAGAAVAVRDSSFLFGSTGTGAARLTINGQPVQVWPNGAWLAWLPFPRDSVMRFQVHASTGTDSARLVHTLRRIPKLSTDSISVQPQGKVWWPAGEYLPVTVHAPAGASVRVRLPDSTIVPFTAVPGDLTRYTGVVRGRSLGLHPGPVLDARGSAPANAPATRSADSFRPMVEAIRGRDTLRTAWPIQLALLDTVSVAVTVNDDTAGRGDTDGITVGRAVPGGTYQWFFPVGTQSVVSGRINGDMRLRLAAGTDVWIAAADARPLPPGTMTAPAVVGSLTVQPRSDRVMLRVPVNVRVPFQVIEQGRSLVLRLYGAAGDIDWIRYGVEDSLVRQVAWSQGPGPEVTVTIDLAAPLWGYRTRWEQHELVLEMRRTPAIDRREPLRGRRIAVDAGHPPAGAMGPTGLREAEANLAVALRLRRMLEAAGATVLMTRTADSAIDLWPRVKLAEEASADLLVSIHNNALPDGVNPFVNHGTSVFYNHSQSLPLARDIQRALLRRLSLRDLGVARGDLALVRSAWMPSVLCEGLFMMIPDQEAALRTAAGQEQYARGVYEGVRNFLEEQGRARESSARGEIPPAGRGLE